MSDDLDPKANHALRVLRQARLSRNETAAIMVGDASRYLLAFRRRQRQPRATPRSWTNSTVW
jgi:hypothetical protein